MVEALFIQHLHSSYQQVVILGKTTSKLTNIWAKRETKIKPIKVTFIIHAHNNSTYSHTHINIKEKYLPIK